MTRSPRDWALWLTARFLAPVIDGAAWVGARVPARAAHRAAALCGNLLWLLRPTRRRTFAANLCRVIGTDPSDRRVRRLARRVMVNEARVAADLFWALGRPREFLDTVVYDGIEHAQAAAGRGRGVILAGTHLGGWEVATAIPSAILPVPTSVVVADNWLSRAIEHARATAGLQVMYPEVAAMRGVRRLRSGEAVVVLGDNSDWARRTHRVRFLDGEVDMAAGVVAMARLAGSPIVSFTVLPLGPRRWRVVMGPPVDPPPLQAGKSGEQPVLQGLVDGWSEAIRANPEHWFLSSPLSWTRPEPEEDIGGDPGGNPAPRP